MFGAWDEGHREFAIALAGLPDADLWTRPHPRLLSVGELAGHIAFWEAIRAVGGSNQPDVEALSIRSPLVNAGFRYYTTNVGQPFKVELGTSDVLKEVARVHEETKAALAEIGKADPYPGFKGATWEDVIQYQVFHVAYHTGQAYSARHLLGHETEDN
jgi:hypothetical protein